MSEQPLARGPGGALADGHGPEVEYEGNLLNKYKPPVRARWLHSYRTLCHIYGNQVQKMFSSNGRAAFDASAEDFVLEQMRRLVGNKCDVVEEMLAGQIILLDARVKHLAVIAANAEGTENVAKMQESLDKVANSFRKAVLALHEIRRPPTPRIAQQNNAAQQVVIQNVPNKQGCQNGQATLPPHPARPAIASGERLAGPALRAINRPADAGGQGAVPLECSEARAAVGTGDPATPGNDGDQEANPGTNEQ